MVGVVYRGDVTRISAGACTQCVCHGRESSVLRRGLAMVTGLGLFWGWRWRWNMSVDLEFSKFQVDEVQRRGDHYRR